MAKTKVLERKPLTLAEKTFLPVKSDSRAV